MQGVRPPAQIDRRKSAPLCIMRYTELVRTTLDVPAELLTEATQLLGFKSKSDTVTLALRELVRRRRLEELKELLGKVELDVDVARSRRRPRSSRS